MISVCVYAENSGINVYPPVPGLTPSDKYSFKVRTEDSQNWLDPFAFVTTCQQGGETNRYYRHLEDWSNTYINFEMSNNIPVEIEISKVDGSSISTAVVHPAQKVNSCEVVNGKAYVRLNNPALFTVDIDGQMDTQDTGRVRMDGWGVESFYNGPPIHTLTIFANPFLENKPSLNNPNVLTVTPGQIPPSDGSWDVLYFLPGVHDIGRMFRLHSQKSYYIPGDAIVHGTMNNNRTWNDGHNIKIFGHGTLAGERIPHPQDEIPASLESDDWKYRPIEIYGARNSTVEGITITDPAHHSLMLVNGYLLEEPTNVHWTKIFSWRANGDGINPFGNVSVEDCFIRTQDDCLYVNGRGIRRVVLWTDANGSSFVLSPVGDTHENEIIVEDCDVIYNRSIFNTHKGGRVFNLRGEGGGTGGDNIVFRNIRITDPRPTLSTFGIASGAPWSQSPNYTTTRETGIIQNILFQNINVASYSIIDDPETLWGTTIAPLQGFIFDTLVIENELIRDISAFNANEFVTGIDFVSTPAISLQPDTLEESHANDGSISESIQIVLYEDQFTEDVVSGNFVELESVPSGLVPVFTRLSDSVISLTFNGYAMNHSNMDDVLDCQITFNDNAFVGNLAADVIGATNRKIKINFRDRLPPVLLRDEFSDGNINNSSINDVEGGFDVYKVNALDSGLNINEANGYAVLDLTGATTDFPWISMVSKSSFDLTKADGLKCKIVIDSLTPSHWYLRPFVINLRPDANIEPPFYSREANIDPPMGVSLMVGNGQSNCRLALAVSDGITSEWLWEDTDVLIEELVDGFSIELTLNNSNGWSLVFSDALSLPSQISGSWNTLGWNHLFSETTHAQFYLRDDALSGHSPSRDGIARVNIDEIEINSFNEDSLYEEWSELWGEADLSDMNADFDEDGISNFAEYAFNGNPLDTNNSGNISVHKDETFFTVIHSKYQLDDQLYYQLVDKTNLISHTKRTNSWDSQTFSGMQNNYITVSNHYNLTNNTNHFISVEVN